MTERDKIVEIVARASEAVILRRFHAKRIDGYTLKMAQEIGAAALAALEQAGYAVVPRRAIEPFVRYAGMRAEKPLLGMHDEIHNIHTGTEWEATLRVSDCEALAAASSPKE